MATAKMTSKGQLTVPQAVREQLGLATGDRVDFLPGGSDWVILRRRRSVSVRELFGVLPAGAAPAGQDAVDDAIAAQILKEDRRSGG